MKDSATFPSQKFISTPDMYSFLETVFQTRPRFVNLSTKSKTVEMLKLVKISTRLLLKRQTGAMARFMEENHTKNNESSTPKNSPSLLGELTNLPNLLTLGRIFAVPVVCALMMVDTPLASFIAALTFGLAAATDFLDGFLARKLNQISVIGKFLDPLADKLIVLAVLLVLLNMERVPLWLAVILMAREITITGLRAIASSEGLVIAARSLGKYKTAFQLSGLAAMIVHSSYIINLGFWESEVNLHTVGLVLLYFAFFFSVTSAGDYFLGFFRAMKNKRS